MTEEAGEFRIIITPRAAADLEEIRDYIAERSPQSAPTMIGRLLDALEPLKRFPHGTVVEQRRHDLLRQPVRSLVVKPYVIFFRVIDDERVVRVLRVRHGARRRPRRFG